MSVNNKDQTGVTDNVSGVKPVHNIVRLQQTTETSEYLLIFVVGGEPFNMVNCG